MEAWEELWQGYRGAEERIQAIQKCLRRILEDGASKLIHNDAELRSRKETK